VIDFSEIMSPAYVQEMRAARASEEEMAGGLVLDAPWTKEETRIVHRVIPWDSIYFRLPPIMIQVDDETGEEVFANAAAFQEIMGLVQPPTEAQAIEFQREVNRVYWIRVYANAERVLEEDRDQAARDAVRKEIAAKVVAEYAAERKAKADAKKGLLRR
jgi:hypothetical protein